MTRGEIIIVVLMFLMPFIKSFIESYFKKKGENLATKEDIQGITDLVESIKNDVAFESQRKHEFIEKRTELFLSILRYAEEINQYGLLMNFYVYYESADEKIGSLIQQVKDITTAVGYNQNLIIASEKNLNIDDIKPLLELTPVILNYGAEICNYGAMAMSMMSKIRAANDLYTRCNQDQQYMEAANVAREEIRKLQKGDNPKSKYEDQLQVKTMEYVRFLNKLYNLDFNLCYNYNQPTK